VFKYCTYSFIFAILLFHFILTFGQCMNTNTTILYPSGEILSSRARLHCSIPGNTDNRVQSPNFKTFKELRNRFQGVSSADLCSLAGRYDNPIPIRFLAPIDCIKFQHRGASWLSSVRSGFVGRRDLIDCAQTAVRQSRVRFPCPAPPSLGKLLQRRYF
jgi:hypothetical protein